MSSDEDEPLIVRTKITKNSRGHQQREEIDLIICDRPSWKTKASIICVLLTEGFERFAFYGLMCNMALFLNSVPLLWSSYNAINMILIFFGISYLMTLIGGWISDSGFSKFWTIFLFFIIYIGGFSIWPSLTELSMNPECDKKRSKNLWCFSSNFTNHSLLTDKRISLSEESCSWVIILSLLVISIGYGAVRVNLVPFGASQVENKDKNSLRIYFNWLYWFINIGSFLAYGVLGYIQQEVSYFYGYLVPLISLVVAFVIFLSGSFFYLRRVDAESPLTSVVKVLFSATKQSCKTCCICCNNPERTSSPDGLLTSERSSFFPRDFQTPPPSSSNSTLPGWIDRASQVHGGDLPDPLVQRVKCFFKIFLIFFSLIPYWTVYYQMQTTFLIQGLHMRIESFNFSNNNSIPLPQNHSLQIPITWLSLFNILFVILFVPFLDRVVYPFLDRKGVSPTLRFRVLFGMVFSTLAMLVAGVVERVRLKIYWGEDNVGHPYLQYIACTQYFAADFSIFWQIPQYLLIGISEVFTSIAGLELAFILSPPSLQSIIMGLFYLSQGVGAIFGMVIVYSLEWIWFPLFDHGNINCRKSPFASNDQLLESDDTKCHLDYYFFVLAALQLFGIFLFLVVSVYLNFGMNSTMRSSSLNRRNHVTPGNENREERREERGLSD